MAESYDVIVVGAGLPGAAAAVAASARGASVLLLERGAAAGSTGPSGGVIRPGGLADGAVDAALAERTIVEHRLLVLDEAASVSFDFHDASMARGPLPSTSVRSQVVSSAWCEAARQQGARLVTDAQDVQLLTDTSGGVVGVSESGVEFRAPLTIATDPIDSPPARRRAVATGTVELEETYAVASRSLENRFQLAPGEGTSLECILGFLPPGWSGTGWLVTHREHVTIGIALHRPQGAEVATGLESAFERFRTHSAIQGYTSHAERVDRRSYVVASPPSRRGLASRGLVRAGRAAGLGDPVGVFSPGLSSAIRSGRAAGESVPGKAAAGGAARSPTVAYLARLHDAGLDALLAHARSRPVPLGLAGDRRRHYARTLAQTFHELLSESGGPKESITRTMRRVRRASRTSYTALASDVLTVGRHL